VAIWRTAQRKKGDRSPLWCDAGGKVSCCDDQQCITVVAITKPKIPGGMRGPTTGTILRRGVEGEQSTSSEKEGK
jgi:hypothetical protein